MAEQNNLVSVPKEENIISITAEDVRKYICPLATANEVGLFLKIAQINNLNPFKREVYLIKYGQAPAQIVTGYETYLKRAERSGQYGGAKIWVEGSVEKGNLVAKVEIYRKDWDKPFTHEVDYSEYVAKTKDGTPTRFWREKPKTMLKKVAMSQAFRFAFPDEVGGLPYTQDEINTIEPELKPVIGKQVDVETGEIVESKPVEQHSQEQQPPKQERKIEIKRPDDPATPAQIRKLNTLITVKGLMKEQVRARAKLLFNKESSKELTKGQISELIGYYDSLTPEKTTADKVKDGELVEVPEVEAPPVDEGDEFESGLDQVLPY